MTRIVVTVEVEGLEALRQRLVPARLLGPALRRAFTDAAAIVRTEARQTVPVDTGRLRAAHLIAVDADTVPVWARVTADTPYARYVHAGTRPHWPPVAALTGWAHRHGISPYAVQRAIGTRGTRAQPWLRVAVDRRRRDIHRAFAAAARAIETAWRQG